MLYRQIAARLGYSTFISQIPSVGGRQRRPSHAIQKTPHGRSILCEKPNTQCQNFLSKRGQCKAFQ